MSLSLATRRSLLLEIRGRIDADGGGALWIFVDEPMPASPESATVGTPAAVIPLGAVSFGRHATLAEMTCTAVGNATLGGIVTFGRFVDGSGVGVLDRTAGPPGAGAQLIVSDLQDPPTARVWSGGELSVTHTLTAY